MFRYRQINNQPILLRGGIAIPIRPGVKLLKGRTHATGGIDDGRVEAENNEVVAETPNAVIYGSAHNILDLHNNGQITPAKKKMGGNISPAKLIIAGVNPEVVNDAQQAYKDRFNLNDDGTKKTGGKKKAKYGKTVNNPNTPNELPEIIVTANKNNILNNISNFINDELLFNKNNIRLHNINNKPNALDNFKIAENVLEFSNYGSLGLLNRLSPTQNIRFGYDILKGNNLIDSWMGNNGIVYNNFAKNHPYASIMINMLSDGLFNGLRTNFNKTERLNNNYYDLINDAASKNIIGGRGLTMKDLYRAADAQTFSLNPLDWRNSIGNHLRYYIGKNFIYPNSELPTIFRKIKYNSADDILTDKNGNIVFSSPEYRFFRTTDNKNINWTNVTTDSPVRPHNSKWDDAFTLATNAKNLLNKRILSTDPGDTVINGDVVVNPKQITAFSGNPEYITKLQNKGINVITSDNLQQSFIDTNNGIKLDFTNYEKTGNSLIRHMIQSPTINDYKLFDYVFKPISKSNVIKHVNLSNIPITSKIPIKVSKLIDKVTAGKPVSQLYDDSQWGNVFYDPSPRIDYNLRTLFNIDMFPPSNLKHTQFIPIKQVNIEPIKLPEIDIYGRTQPINIQNVNTMNKKALGGRLTVVHFTGKIKQSKTTDTTVAKLGTKKAYLGAIEPNLTKENIIIGNDGTPYYRDKRTGMIHKLGDTAFVNGKFTRIGDFNVDNVELNDRPVNTESTSKPQTTISANNMFNNVTFPVADFSKDGDVPWLNRIPSTSTLSTKPTITSTTTTPTTTFAKSTPTVTPITKVTTSASATKAVTSTAPHRITPATTPTKDITLDFGDTPVIDRSTPAEKIHRRPSTLSRTRISPTPVVETPEIIDGMEIAKPKIDVNPTTIVPDIKVNVPNTQQLNLWEKLKTDFKNNTADYIGDGANLLGSIGSFLTNNYAINKMVQPSAPNPKLAAKLKTRININPQLDKMRETIAMMDRNIRQNTMSSAVALNRINRARFAGNQQVNQLYGQKENQETELINRDKLNQQTVANTNVDTYNQYQDKLTDFYNKKRELKSENTNASIQGLNTTIQNALTRRDKRRQYNLSFEIIRRIYPEATKYLTKNLLS